MPKSTQVPCLHNQLIFPKQFLHHVFQIWDCPWKRFADIRHPQSFPFACFSILPLFAHIRIMNSWFQFKWFHYFVSFSSQWSYWYTNDNGLYTWHEQWIKNDEDQATCSLRNKTTRVPRISNLVRKDAFSNFLIGFRFRSSDRKFSVNWILALNFAPGIYINVCSQPDRQVFFSISH